MQPRSFEAIYFSNLSVVQEQCHSSFQVVGFRSVLFALGFHYHSYSCMLLSAISISIICISISMFVVVCLYSKIGGGGFVSLYLSSYRL